MHTFKFIVTLFLFSSLKALSMPTEIPKTEEEKHELANFFKEKGFIWIKDFFEEEEKQVFNHLANHMNEQAKTALKEHKNQDLPLITSENDLIVVPEVTCSLNVCRVEDMLSVYPDLNSLVDKRITAFLTELFDDPYVTYKDKLNFKSPGGGAFTAHQDFPAYQHLPPRSHITALVHIDQATIENGCLKVAKNWREHFSCCQELDQGMLLEGTCILPYVEGGKNHGSIQKYYSDKIEWLNLEANPKDLILISSHVPHYSEANSSENYRRLMLFTHNRLEEGDHRQQYYETKRSDPLNPIFHFSTPTKARGK